MAEPLAEYEGTWDEIAARAAAFRGHRLRLLVLADRPSPGLSLHERRQILRLPVAARRRILEEQAESLADHYEEDAEWREWLGGDIVEY